MIRNRPLDHRLERKWRSKSQPAGITGEGLGEATPGAPVRISPLKDSVNTLFIYFFFIINLRGWRGSSKFALTHGLHPLLLHALCCHCIYFAFLIASILASSWWFCKKNCESLLSKSQLVARKKWDLTHLHGWTWMCLTEVHRHLLVEEEPVARLVRRMLRARRNTSPSPSSVSDRKMFWGKIIPSMSRC